MKFNKDLLDTYQLLLETTYLQKAYQEFVQLFRYIRIELENEMPDYKFQGHISENAMNFAYFQLTNSALINKGLKISVVFMHGSFQFEVWLSGCNRQYQMKYHELLKNIDNKYTLTENPNQTDYILSYPLSKEMDISNAELLIAQLKLQILELVNDIERELY